MGTTNDVMQELLDTAKAHGLIVEINKTAMPVTPWGVGVRTENESVYSYRAAGTIEEALRCALDGAIRMLEQ